MGLVNVNGTHLRGQDHIPVVRDVVPGGAKAVAVQHRSQQVSVTEHDGGRPIPWLHHGRVIVVEILHLLGHGLVMPPGCRDHDHHGQGKIHTAHHHKLQGIVQHSGIRSILVDNGEHLVHLRPEKF